VRNLSTTDCRAVENGTPREKTSFGDSGLESEGRIERVSGSATLTRVGGDLRRAISRVQQQRKPLASIICHALHTYATPKTRESGIIVGLVSTEPC